MRYYDISLIQPSSGRVLTLSPKGGFALGGTTGSTFSSLTANGANNPAALDVEIDMPIYPWHTPQGGSYIRVWGIPIQALSQSWNLSGYNFSLNGGMSKGLPLANPAQAGLLASGTIFQGFGNWEGTDQTIDLIVNPGGTDNNQNIIWNWKKGTQISAALAQTFAQAFPQYKAVINVGNIVLPGDDVAIYQSLSTFAQHVNDITVRYGTPTYGQHYPGVCITITGNTINAFDATVPTKVTQLNFQDFVGQPTWIEALTINFKTVLRADLQVGSFIKFPPEVISPYVLTTDAAAFPNSPARNRSIFQGLFFLTEVHHFARFRQADAQSWVTAFRASPALGG